MPDNPSPAARSDTPAEPTEFNFDKPASDIPRLKRRSLKGKEPGLKPASAPPTARELEREAPPLSAEEAAKPVAPAPETPEVRPETAPRATPAAPPKTTPAVAAAATQRPATTVSSSSLGQKAANAAGIKPANGTGVAPAASGQKVNIALTAQQKATVSAPAAAPATGSSTSPHGTRPATLYYTSQPKKEATTSMKTTPSAASASATSASAASARPAQATTASTSTTRPAASTTAASTVRPAPSTTTPNGAASATRPATATVNPASTTRPAAANFDYRANVERQSREQKSVGSVLGYFVYGLIAVFLIGAALATYGSVVIFDKLHDQSTSISSLDDKYSAKVADLNKQLAATQDTLAQAQAQTARQLDLLNKQEEEINQLRAAVSAASTASGDAIHAEAHARAQEAASLRARIRDLEYKASLQNSTTRP